MRASIHLALAVQRLDVLLHLLGVGIHREMTAVPDFYQRDAALPELRQVAQRGVLLAKHEHLREWLVQELVQQANPAHAGTTHQPLT